MNESVDPQAIAVVVVVVKRILVPIDRSGYKDKIIAYAISLGKAWGAEITAIHVIEPRHAPSEGGAQAKEQTREEESRRQAEHLLNEIDTLVCCCCCCIMSLPILLSIILYGTSAWLICYAKLSFLFLVEIKDRYLYEAQITSDII